MEHTTRMLSDNDPPLKVEPTAVECGFMMYPKVLGDLIESGEFNPHEALETSQPRFWPKVRRRNQNILLHLLLALPAVDMEGLGPALQKVGYFDGYNIAVSGETKFSLDGGATTQQLYVGFCWKSQTPEIIVIGPDTVVPKRSKPFWKFW